MWTTVNPVLAEPNHSGQTSAVSPMPKPPFKTTPEQHELAESFVEANHALLPQLSATIAKSDISVPQFLLLTKLAEQEMKMTEVAQFLSLTNAGATQAVDRLQKRKMVERKQD